MESQDVGPLKDQATDRAEPVRLPPAPTPAPVTPPRGSAEAVLALQRSAGNRATGRFLQGGGGAGSAGVRKIQRSKLKDFPSVRSYKVECLAYARQRRGCSHYIMIGPGDDWHISIPVRSAPRDLYAYEFGEYHVTDPDGNHYNYTSRHARDGAGGEAANWKAADALVSKIFGVTPTFVALPEYKKVLLELIGAGKFNERDRLAAEVAAIKREEGISEDEAYRKYLANASAESTGTAKRKREVEDSSPADESKHGHKEAKEEEAPSTTTPATTTTTTTTEVDEEEEGEEEEGEEPTTKK